MKSSRTFEAVLIASAVLWMAWARPAAAAQPATTLGSAGERPWARGISPREQLSARERFMEGNKLLEDSAFADAAAKYRDALAHWDHPAIHYNLALSLIPLEQPIEVRQHLEDAMRYGPEPLGEQKFAHARAYRALLEGQLARVDVKCDAPGALVTLDGETLFVGPGRRQRWVRSGKHTVSAVKEGFVPTDRHPELSPGTQVEVSLRLFTEGELTHYRQPWPTWRPWAVLGTGAVVAAGGGLLHLQARDGFRAFDQGINACGGCVPAPALDQMRVQGERLQKFAIGAYAAGGAAMATGAVLLYLNRPQAYRISPEQEQEPVSVTPLLGVGTTGAMATFHF